jgi:hemerythrin-like domain-containing protein
MRDGNEPEPATARHEPPPGHGNGRTMHRRALLVAALATAAGCVESRTSRGSAAAVDEAEGDVLPVEDLMREHGVLRRVLLIYEEALRRMKARHPIPGDAVAKAAGIVRRFVEDYHERQEESGVFPRFRTAGRLTDLVATLQQQHAAGRVLTDVAMRNAASVERPSSSGGVALSRALEEFIRMYRPHAAWEDTVLLPAFRRVITPYEYAELGDAFEEREKALFGIGGFEHTVAEVEGIERSLGLGDLATFTPGITLGG